MEPEQQAPAEGRGTDSQKCRITVLSGREMKGAVKQLVGQCHLALEGLTRRFDNLDPRQEQPGQHVQTKLTHPNADILICFLMCDSV
jgi:hypothetical protein